MLVKKILCLVAVVAVMFTMSAVAQKSALGRNAVGDNGMRSGNPAAPPTNCNPCLFYGGDWDPNSQWVAYFNGTNTAGLDATVYVPFTVPAGQTWKINSMFTQNLDQNGTGKIDPAIAPWDIRQGVSEGVSGTSVASGSSPAKYVPTGRNYQNFYFEYTAQVKMPVTTIPSGSYWMAVTPQCTNTNDAACSSANYYINDTISRTNHFGPAEPKNMSFHNGPAFGLNWTNVCNEGYPPPACSVMSAGIAGKKSH